MDRQHPTILLTRPRTASERFLLELQERVDLPAVISPVLEIAPVVARIPRDGGLILTSAHAVGPDLAGRPAWVVGRRTAEAAEAAGIDVRRVSEDAGTLADSLLSDPPGVPLTWLRGRHVAADLVGRLAAGGQPLAEVVVYDQQTQPLTMQARDLLAGDAPVLLPLFSARSARLLADAAGSPAAPCTLVAISRPVAEAWPFPAPAYVAVSKDGVAMVQAVADVAAGMLVAPGAPR